MDDGEEVGSLQPTCWFCGEAELLEICDIWTDHNYTLDTCCAGLLEQVSDEMQHDPEWARDLLRRLGAEALTGQRLRRVCDGEGGTPMLDYKLQVRPVTFRDACAFVRRHHAHNAPPVSWRMGHAVWNGRHTLIGVAMVGNPVARALNGRGIVEVNRLCVRRDIAPMLCRDACSKLYSVAARAAERAGFVRIISYTRQDEDGASLRAAGWVPDATVRGRSWHSKRRARSNTNAFVDKVRWSRTLHPKPAGKPPPAVSAVPGSWPGWLESSQAGLTLCQGGPGWAQHLPD